MTSATQISYRNELARKGIHLSSLLIPIVYLQVDRATALWLLIPATAITLAVNVLLQFHVPSRNVLMRVFGGLLRGHELQSRRLVLNGASWVLIAATCLVATMPKVLAITGFTILIVSDTLAALIGRRWGRRRFLDKTLLGSLTFFVSALCCLAVYLVLYDLPWTYAFAGIAGSAVGTMAEAASVRLRVDDNISIPFSIAVVMWCVALGLDYGLFPAFLGAMS